VLVVKVTLHLAGGGVHVCKVPYPGANRVFVEAACPECKAEAPIDIRGRGIKSHDHDTYYADAEHVGCGGSLGTLHAKVDTIFGIEEDEAMLKHGRARVY